MRRHQILGFSLALGLLAGAGQPARAAEPGQLIPRQVLFGNPDRSSVQLSPDGKMISYRAPVDGVMNVWVGPAKDPAKAQPVTKDTHRGIPAYFWSYAGGQILYIQDKNGDENWRVYSVDVKTHKEVDLTPYDGVAAQIQGVSKDIPNEILVGLNDRIPQLHDLYRINIKTGERKLVLKNDRFLGFVSDDTYTPRLAITVTPFGGMQIFQAKGEEWDHLMDIGPEDVLSTSPIGFDKTGEIVYFLDSQGQDTTALIAHNLTTGDRKVIFTDDRADISNVLTHPTENTIEAVAVNYTRQEWKILDDSIRRDLDRLAKVDDGDPLITSRTLDDQNWTVAFVRDDGPVRYYTFNRKSGEAKFLFTNREAIADLPLAKMHPVVIEARDGLKLVSYLSLPSWSDPDGDGRPDKAVPMVLNVHGGPWARDSWGYDSYHQWLTNRGYAVLSVNFRGSTGFGKGFTNAGDGEWGAKMHDDLLDAVQWAVDEGIAIEDKVAIMGGSYGGYATLVGLTFTPEVFACGVDIVGPSNLVTLLRNVPPYWMPMLPVMSRKVGDVNTVEGRRFLRSVSPLTHVDEIVRPLLIGQGANDPRVKQMEADQIVAAMEAREIPVTYVLYPDEGHGFRKPENNLSFNAVTEAFLAEHLGGRFEPIGDDFEGASIEVVTGADQVPGLAEEVGDAGEAGSP